MVILTSLPPDEIVIGMACRQSLTEFPGRADFSAGGRQAWQTGTAAGLGAAIFPFATARGRQKSPRGVTFSFHDLRRFTPQKVESS